MGVKVSGPVERPIRGRSPNHDDREKVKAGDEPWNIVPWHFNPGIPHHAPSFRPHHQSSPTVAVVCCLLRTPCTSVRNDG